VLRPILQGLALAAITALTPTLGFAHTGAGPAGGFAHGLLHPIAGLDHVLAMVMVGMFAWQLGGRALWLVPTTFVLIMALGGALGIAGAQVPYVEASIGLSVVILGAAVAFGIRASLAVVMGVVALFAVFHGHAHGTEMPESAAGLAYGFGFMVATALLHVGGLGLGSLIGRADRFGPVMSRAAGACAAIAGIAILTGAL
jgi:urease accessory protein